MSCFDLLAHAEGHYCEKGDIDKRLAVIGFDNAIESAITTYLSLKPIQRKGIEYRRQDIDGWLRDHPSKLRFFYEELDRRNLEHKATEAELGWYHSIRNDAYHSGIGVVPSERCRLGVREAAIWVFSVLFEVPDVEIAVCEAVARSNPSADTAMDEYLKKRNELVSVEGMIYSPGEVLRAVYPEMYREMSREYSKGDLRRKPQEHHMIEIHPNLFVGHQGDYEYQVEGQDGWAVVHACKEPYHRQLLGYRTKGAPKSHPEYYFAERGNRLYLNLVDAPDPAYIPQQLIDKAITFIHEKLAEGLKVLVHCNQGESRSPGIGFLYLLGHTDVLPKSSLDDALAKFRQIYSAFYPGRGISGFIAEHWQEYAGGHKDE
jgi:hypothetical protein